MSRGWTREERGKQEDRDMTPAQAAALFLLEVKFAQPHTDPEGQPSWVDAVAVLVAGYLAVGGTYDELQERFADVRTPQGRHLFAAKGWR